MSGVSTANTAVSKWTVSSPRFTASYSHSVGLLDLTGIVRNLLPAKLCSEFLDARNRVLMSGPSGTGDIRRVRSGSALDPALAVIIGLLLWPEWQ